MTGSLFVDHSDLSTLQQSLDINSDRLPPTRVDQQFWSTPARMAQSPSQETLQVSLASERLINTLSFDVARFPHAVRIEYQLSDATGWVPVIDAATGAKAVVTILQSVPQMLPKATSVPGHLHPQHSYAGHWETVSLRLRPFTARKIRLILQRVEQSQPPVDAFGLPVPYSLAVANLLLGYEIADPADLPRRGLRSDSLTSRESFATTSDLLGSSVDYALRVNAADNIRDNADDDASLIWRCEPQPYPQAVVNFYADLRDSHGRAQVLDRVFIDPINNGAHISLYHSADIPTSGFVGSSEPLNAAQASLQGQAVISDGSLQLGGYGTEASVGIDNDWLGFDPMRPWWLGLDFTLRYDQGTDLDNHPLFDCGSVALCLTPTGLQLSANTGDQLPLVIGYQGGLQMKLLASYDGQSLRLRARTVVEDVEAEMALSQPILASAIDQIALGSDLAGQLFANVNLASLVLKEEALVSDGYLDDTLGYADVPEFAGQDTGLEANALLRLDPTNPAISGFYPSGLFGGPADRYAAMVWTPITRDYTMQRGWMFLPGTRARYLKLEITNLQAEYRDIHVPVARRVRNFPPELWSDYRQNLATRGRSGLAEDQGLAVLASLTSGLPYRDFPIYISTGGTQRGYTNTEVYVAEDYATGQRLYQSRGWAWNVQGWHPGTAAPRWNKTGQHRYAIDVVRQSAKVAYTVGLRQIAFARAVFTSSEDAAQYEDMLFDEQNIAASNWTYDLTHDALYSGAVTRKARATSIVFGSIRNVRGVQFAAQQSPPRQLLPDPDFADPQYRNWLFVGDANKAAQAILTPLVGTALPVTRSVVIGYWGDIAPIYPTWGDLSADAVLYGDLANTSHRPETEGGIASLPVAQPTGGRIYAAARVVASEDLRAPLWVQIVDSTNNAVLAEEPIEVKRDQITEWYTSYTVGEGGAYHINHWGDLAGAPTRFWPNFADSFTRADASTLGQLDAGPSWAAGGTGSLHLVSNKATVTAAGQADYLDTLTPWGSLKVSLGNTVTAGSAPASVRLLDLGGFLVMNDGRVIDAATTDLSAPVLTLASADQLQFDLLPTKVVPGPQLPGGADPNLTPYALVISRNGGWVTTLLTARGFTTQRGLWGDVGQEFTAFSWTPSYAEVPDGAVVAHLPMPDDGELSLDGGSWTQASGEIWSLTGNWTFADGPAYSGGIAQAAAGSVDSVIYRDLHQSYGSLVFKVAQLAATVDPTSYVVATLDSIADTSLQLRANGDLVRADGTLVKAGVVPSITGGEITVRFIRVSQLSSSFKTTYSIPNTDIQALIFLQGGVVVGTVSGTSLWVGTTRALNGYNDGAGNYTVHEGFAWAPDAALVGADSRIATWGDVDRDNTYTWGDLIGARSVNTNPVYLQVIQKNASDDSWFMDNASLFVDPIEWEFSNDGGSSWLPALDIRNDPNGVLLFTEPDPTDVTISPQNQLAWRVTSWGAESWVSHLVIRPWYKGLTRGVIPRTSVIGQGPNINPYDHYPPIEQDPRFKVWHRPVPRDWWFIYRNPDLLDTSAQWIDALVTDAIVLDPDGPYVITDPSTLANPSPEPAPVLLGTQGTLSALGSIPAPSVAPAVLTAKTITQSITPMVINSQQPGTGSPVGLTDTHALLALPAPALPYGVGSDPGPTAYGLDAYGVDVALDGTITVPHTASAHALFSSTFHLVGGTTWYSDDHLFYGRLVRVSSTVALLPYTRVSVGAGRTYEAGVIPVGYDGSTVTIGAAVPAESGSFTGGYTLATPEVVVTGSGTAILGIPSYRDLTNVLKFVALTISGSVVTVGANATVVDPNPFNGFSLSGSPVGTGSALFAVGNYFFVVDGSLTISTAYSNGLGTAVTSNTTNLFGTVQISGVTDRVLLFTDVYDGPFTAYTIVLHSDGTTSALRSTLGTGIGLSLGYLPERMLTDGGVPLQTKSSGGAYVDGPEHQWHSLPGGVEAGGFPVAVTSDIDTSVLVDLGVAVMGSGRFLAAATDSTVTGTTASTSSVTLYLISESGS